MNANDCLTALKFGHYLQNLKPKQKMVVMNLEGLEGSKTAIEGELVKIWKDERVWAKSCCGWLDT